MHAGEQCLEQFIRLFNCSQARAGIIHFLLAVQCERITFLSVSRIEGIDHPRRSFANHRESLLEGSRAARTPGSARLERSQTARRSRVIRITSARWSCFPANGCRLSPASPLVIAILTAIAFFNLRSSWPVMSSRYSYTFFKFPSWSRSSNFPICCSLNPSPWIRVYQEDHYPFVYLTLLV